MLHLTNTFTDLFHDKCQNLITYRLNQIVMKFWKLVFNVGFSALLILLSNPEIRLTSVDIGVHLYTLPCFHQLKKDFGNRIQLLLGSSIVILPIIYHQYDLIHIDGGNFDDCVKSDMIQSLRLSKPGSILIMDDYNFGNIRELWDNFCQEFHLTNVVLIQTEYHSIMRTPVTIKKFTRLFKIIYLSV